MAALLSLALIKLMVNGKGYSAKVILIATGGWPYIPEFPGSEHGD